MATTREASSGLSPSETSASVPSSLLSSGVDDDGFDPRLFPPLTAEGQTEGQNTPQASPGGELAADQPPADPAAIADEIAAIRKEGLSARQLRLARRIGNRHGIEADSDYEIVRQLRQRGIDPFDRQALLSNTVAPDGARAVATIPSPKVPQKQTSGAGMPTPLQEDERAREIMRVQRDIARRRRRKLGLMFARLAFFVFLPTLIAAYYFYAIATPMYATNSAFVIQKADAADSSSPLGGLFSGTQFATSQDSISVQAYLQSREAMRRLDQDEGFRKVFSAPDIDPLQRLDTDASESDAFKLYLRNVKVSFDTTEGILRMEVSAPDPKVSEEFSKALIKYAEEQVDRMTARMRSDQMSGAKQSFDDAESKVEDAQQRVLDLQQKLGVLDPTSETGVVMSQISALQSQLSQKQLELGQLLDNPTPNQARVDGARGDIARLQQMISDQRAELTKTRGGSESLAEVTGQLQIAQADLATRQTLLASAVTQMETARIEAGKQVRYLETGVRPIAPDQPTYPRAFEDTVLAFLIFSGIYLMLSLTASILREQVSS